MSELISHFNSSSDWKSLTGEEGGISVGILSSRNILYVRKGSKLFETKIKLNDEERTLSRVQLEKIAQDVHSIAQRMFKENKGADNDTSSNAVLRASVRSHVVQDVTSGGRSMRECAKNAQAVYDALRGESPLSSQASQKGVTPQTSPTADEFERWLDTLSKSSLSGTTSNSNHSDSSNSAHPMEKSESVDPFIEFMRERLSAPPPTLDATRAQDAASPMGTDGGEWSSQGEELYTAGQNTFQGDAWGKWTAMGDAERAKHLTPISPGEGSSSSRMDGPQDQNNPYANLRRAPSRSGEGSSSSQVDGPQDQNNTYANLRRVPQGGEISSALTSSSTFPADQQIAVQHDSTSANRGEEFASTSDRPGTYARPFVSSGHSADSKRVSPEKYTSDPGPFVNKALGVEEGAAARFSGLDAESVSERGSGADSRAEGKMIGRGLTPQSQSARSPGPIAPNAEGTPLERSRNQYTSLSNSSGNALGQAQTPERGVAAQPTELGPRSLEKGFAPSTALPVAGEGGERVEGAKPTPSLPTPAESFTENRALGTASTELGKATPPKAPSLPSPPPALPTKVLGTEPKMPSAPPPPPPAMPTKVPGAVSKTPPAPPPPPGALKGVPPPPPPGKGRAPAAKLTATAQEVKSTAQQERDVLDKRAKELEDIPTNIISEGIKTPDRIMMKGLQTRAEVLQRAARGGTLTNLPILQDDVIGYMTLLNSFLVMEEKVSSVNQRANASLETYANKAVELVTRATKQNIYSDNYNRLLREKFGQITNQKEVGRELDTLLGKALEVFSAEKIELPKETGLALRDAVAQIRSDLIQFDVEGNPKDVQDLKEANRKIAEHHLGFEKILAAAQTQLDESASAETNAKPISRLSQLYFKSLEKSALDIAQYSSQIARDNTQLPLEKDRNRLVLEINKRGRSDRNILTSIQTNFRERTKEVADDEALLVPPLSIPSGGKGSIPLSCRQLLAEPHPGKFLDAVMQVIVNGQLRTKALTPVDYLIARIDEGKVGGITGDVGALIQCTRDALISAPPTADELCCMIVQLERADCSVISENLYDQSYLNEHYFKTQQPGVVASDKKVEEKDLALIAADKERDERALQRLRELGSGEAQIIAGDDGAIRLKTGSGERDFNIEDLIGVEEASIVGSSVVANTQKMRLKSSLTENKIKDFVKLMTDADKSPYLQLKSKIDSAREKMAATKPEVMLIEQALGRVHQINKLKKCNFDIAQFSSQMVRDNTQLPLEKDRNQLALEINKREKADRNALTAIQANFRERTKKVSDDAAWLVPPLSIPSGGKGSAPLSCTQLLDEAHPGKFLDAVMQVIVKGQLRIQGALTPIDYLAARIDEGKIGGVAGDVEALIQCTRDEFISDPPLPDEQCRMIVQLERADCQVISDNLYDQSYLNEHYIKTQVLAGDDGTIPLETGSGEEDLNIEDLTGVEQPSVARSSIAANVQKTRLNASLTENKIKDFVELMTDAEKSPYLQLKSNIDRAQEKIDATKAEAMLIEKALGRAPQVSAKSGPNAKAKAETSAVKSAETSREQAQPALENVAPLVGDQQQEKSVPVVHTPKSAPPPPPPPFKKTSVSAAPTPVKASAPPPPPPPPQKSGASVSPPPPKVNAPPPPPPPPPPKRK